MNGKHLVKNFKVSKLGLNGQIKENVNVPLFSFLPTLPKFV